MSKLSKILMALPLFLGLGLASCNDVQPSSQVSESVISEPESTSTETESSEESSEEEQGISYTVEEAINAVAEALGGKSVSDYSDEEGPYFVTGAAYYAESVSADDLKEYVPYIMPEGFELVSDWSAGTFSDNTEYEGCYYLCGDVVLANAVYADNYDGTDVIVLQVSAYSIA